MWRLNLTTRLTLIVMILSTLIATLVAGAISSIVFFRTEDQIKRELTMETKKIVNDYLVVENETIRPKDRNDSETLAIILRNLNLSLLIVDRDRQPVAMYGIYRNFNVEQIDRFMQPEILDQAQDNQIGVYKDFESESFGTYDTYTIPLITETQLVGYFQVAKPNNVLPLLRSSLIVALLILLPIVWLVSLVVAGASTRMVLSPFRQLVIYMEKLDANDPKQVISAPIGLDYETSILTKSFNTMMERVRQTLRRQRELTENISHEFKTPLTRIATSLQVLSSDQSPENQKKIARIEKEVVNLGEHVDALLDVAVGDLTTLEDRKPWKLRKLLDELVSAKPEGLQIMMEVPYAIKLIHPPLPQARILFTNLLQNAFKYTPKGGNVWISGLISSRNWIVRLENTIADPVSKIEKLFGRYNRDRKRVDKNGHGLGLAIVKEIGDKNGISIQMESEDNSRFKVILKGRL